ncbi:efflux transporter outer membrane subunit [Marinobacterium rhizophilum]|uniref:efflux transporter outer membrane subunit n=1 Tax=Marinobacterium rhizophilum TaxID=420402 RepID=UPI000364D6FF|nr:efflux transporter outer membrane subunit [Marinobacterium rhizophilum]
MRLFAPGAAYCLLAGIMLAGCNAYEKGHTEYQRPELPQKSDWVGPEAAVQVSANETIQPDWWTGFNDPYLDQLIETALAGNLDLKILAARIDAAEAAIGEERSTLLPSVGANVSAQLQASPLGTTQQFGAQASANWEIDVWGKARKGVQAQTAEYQATEADWRAGYLTMAADLADTYFAIRRLDEQLQRQRSALDKNRRILAIYRQQHQAGLIPDTRIRQQQAEIHGLQDTQVDLVRLRRLAENRLATLLGRPAGDFRVPPATLTDTVSLPVVPAGLPSQLVSRRPDIIAREYRVLQVHHLVGQAHLAKLPGFSLTGNGGFASAVLSGLLGNWSLGLAPAMNIPIFDPGIEARLATREAQERIAEEEYRKTVLLAFEEVENALTNLAARKERLNEVRAQIDQLAQVRNQIDRQVQLGMASQLEVFESERSVLAAQQNLLQLHGQILSDTVTLYKVLGGGWPSTRVH